MQSLVESMLLQMALFYYFLQANGIPLCICTMSSLLFHLLMDISVVPYLGSYEDVCYKHRGTGIFLNYSFVQVYDQTCGGQGERGGKRDELRV